MITIASSLLAMFAVLLAIPTAVFAMEILAALFLSTSSAVAIAIKPRGRIAVLIPAHNEASGIIPTLNDVKAQLRTDDRIIVVADNCTDDTASIASSAGAEVTVRSDLTRIGKGYALHWGIKHLAFDPPEIVIVVDADCRITTDALDRLAIVAAQKRRPVQSLYLMTAPIGSSINHQVAEFAWRLKNWVRPLGLSTFSLPCQLMGTGMAFPWQIIQSADLASGFIVEDLKLGLELAAAGHAPRFCPSAVVTSVFPTSADGAYAQRQRWEHGHIGLILTKAVPLTIEAIKRRDLNLLALVSDLLIPPLSLFGAILIVYAAIAGIAAVLGVSSTPLIISLSCLAIVAGAAILAWFKHGRDILPAGSFGLVASFILVKIRLYLAAALGRRVSLWIRADRN